MVSPKKPKGVSRLMRQWAAAHRQGQAAGATPLPNKWKWQHLIARSELSPTSRLVAHTLCLHGLTNGDRIFPSQLRLAAETGLTERSVCTHIDLIVRSGWLMRTIKNTGRDWAGTTYILTVPTAALPMLEQLASPWEDDPTWKPDSNIAGTESPSVPERNVATDSTGTEPPSVPGTEPLAKDVRGAESDARGTEPRSDGTERRAVGALKDVHTSLKPSVSNRVLKTQGASARTMSDSVLRPKVKSMREAGMDDATILKSLAPHYDVSAADIKRVSS